MKINRRGFLKSASAFSAVAIGTGTNCAMGQTDSDDSATNSKVKSRLVDCHLHINHFDRSVEDTIRHMDATGTDKAFILPLETGEGGVLLTADTVLAAYSEHKDRIIPFCQCDVRKPDVVERILAYHKLGCRGVGEQKEHVALNDPRIERVIALCDELNWPITIHFQDGKNGFNMGIKDHLEPYLKKFPTVRIIGHAQSWWANISADVPDATKSLYPKGPVKPGGLIEKLMGDYPNLYADLSAGSGYGALTRDEDFTAGFLERNSKQILFGSDCPCRDGKGENFKGTCYSTRLQALLKKLIKDPDRLKDVFHRNVMRALNGK